MNLPKKSRKRLNRRMNRHQIEETSGEVEDKAGEETDKSVSGEEKPASDDVGEEKPSSDYESDDNPYKKRYHDTSVWANKINQENLGLKADVKRIEQKLDGTYDEEANEPSPEQLEQQANLQGRINASLRMAKDKHGDAYIAENIDNPDSDYQKMRQQNPLIDMRVQASETPYLEAVKILEEEKFFSEHGRTPEKIFESISKEIESGLREKITKEFQDKLKEKRSFPRIQVISEVRCLKEGDEPKFKPEPLGEIFQH